MQTTLRQKLGLLVDKVRGPVNPTVRSFTSSETQQEQARIQHFQRLYDYYINDEDDLKLYTQRAMQTVFKTSTIDRLMLPYFNIVRRIINRICLAYKLAPSRYILIPKSGEGDTIVDDPTMAKANENYQGLLSDSNINSRSKEWHRLAKLLDTVYVQPVWRDEHLDYDIFPPHQLTVTEDPTNFLKASRVEYQRVGKDGKTQRVIWTAENHWVLDEKGKIIPEENPWNGDNRYGVLPFAILRLRETENHWGEGDSQLVDINEKINIVLASLNYNALMQSHGQPVAINIDLAGEIQIGPDHPIIGKQVSGDATPDFKFVQPQPAIEENIKYIDWLIKTAAMQRGLPAAAVSTEISAQSGAAKAIDNWELLELREDDLEYLRPFEKLLFDISRAVWNFHATSQRQIIESAVFGIDFEEPKAPVSELDDLDAKMMRLELGLWTPVDDMIDEDEGINEDIALQYVRRNLQIRNELKDEFGLGAVITKPVDPNQPPTPPSEPQ
jgi:hypothetical protein